MHDPDARHWRMSRSKNVPIQQNELCGVSATLPRAEAKERLSHKTSVSSAGFHPDVDEADGLLMPRRNVLGIHTGSLLNDIASCSALRMEPLGRRLTFLAAVSTRRI